MMKPALSQRVVPTGIVAAAMGVFARLGFAATRVEDVLEAAGVARRTFYKYFTGKEDVLAAVYDLASGELLRALRESPAVGGSQGPAERGDPLATLDRGLDLYLDFHVENGALLKVLIEQAVSSDSPLWHARRRFRADLSRLIDDAVRQATGQGYDPMLYAALLSALEGLSLDLVAMKAGPAELARAKAAMHLLLTRVLAPARVG